MNLLKQWFGSIKEQNILFERNRKEIQNINNKTVKSLIRLFICLFAMLLAVLLLFYDNSPELIVPYTVVLCTITLISIFNKYITAILPVEICMYVYYSIFLVYITYISAWVYPDFISVAALALFVQVPMIIIDRVWRVNLMVIGFALIYLAFVIPAKDSVLLFDEVINTITFCVLGIVLGGILRKTRLENLEMKRLALIGENTDYLTGLYNRRKLWSFVEGKEVTPKPFVTDFAMIDIDAFKCYNDTYGHPKGDQCLSDVSKALLALKEKYPIYIFRYGGEEFAVLGYLSEGMSFLDICEEMRGSVEALCIPHRSWKYNKITISIGVAQKNGEAKEDFETMIYQADNALYQAKNNGKNCVALYSENG